MRESTLVKRAAPPMPPIGGGVDRVGLADDGGWMHLAAGGSSVKTAGDVALARIFEGQPAGGGGHHPQHRHHLGDPFSQPIYRDVR